MNNILMLFLMAFVLLLSGCKSSGGGAPALSGGTPTVTAPVPTPTFNYFDPASSPSYDMNPTFIVGNLPYTSSSVTLHLYNGGTCSSGQLLASVNATGATGAYLYMETNHSGYYLASIKATDNQAGNSSSCVSLPYTVSAPPIPSSLTRQSPSTATGYDDTPTIRVSGVVSGHSVKLYQDSGCTLLAGSGSASGSTIDITSSSLAIGTYEFHARDVNEAAEASGCSTASVTYQYLLPPSPSGLSMSSPSSGSGYDETPTIQVSGVVSGHTVRLYKDSSCSLQVGSGTAYSTTITITSSTLSIGTYEFHARDLNPQGDASDCSTSFVSYQLLSPPTPSALSLSSPSTSPNTDPTPTILVSGVGSDVVVKLYTDSGCTAEVGSGNAYATTIQLTSAALTPENTYNFYARSSVGATTSSCSSATVAYNLQYLPLPSPLERLVPTAASEIYNYAKIRVSGVASQDQNVVIYSDASCTNAVGSGDPSGATIDILTNTLAVGSYTFYAKRFGGDGGRSQCSTANTAYEVLTNNRLVYSSTVHYTRSYVLEEMGIGDVNGDNIMDIFSINGFGGYLSLGSGSGSGSYGTSTNVSSLFTSSGGGPVAFGDFDGDGDDDLVSGDWYTDKMSYRSSNGNGTFATKVDYAISDNDPNEIKIADVDKDGDLDLILALGLYSNSGRLAIFKGSGNGSFAPVAEYASDTGISSVSVGDLNNDTYPDVVAALTNTDEVAVYLNNGDGTFAAKVDYAVGDGPYDVELSDLNNDGKLDIVALSTTSKNISVRLGVGDGTFGANTNYDVYATNITYLSLGDVDNDGNQDVVVASDYDTKLHVLFGNGDGTLTPNLDFPLTGKGGRLQVIDLSGDGGLDIVVPITYSSVYGLDVFLK